MNKLQIFSSIYCKQARLKTACIFVLAGLLGACADDGVQTGAGAGDTLANVSAQAAIALLEPFVGVYELQDGWRGELGDRAFLSIRLTANDGVSETVFIDFDDADNCIPQRFSTGEVIKDNFSDRVFLNDIFEFDEAELSLSGNTLSIESEDSFDIDNDQNRSELITIQATRLGLAEVDLGVPCT